MVGLETRIYGVTFESVREALVTFFFKYKGMTKEELDKARSYVIPMQHNFLQPINPGGQDTWIQFWIDNDDRLTQDTNVIELGMNTTQKVAHVTVRFLGARAEAWAKSFHHLAGRKSSFAIWRKYCAAQQLHYIHPIVPTNVDYFGVGNTTVAFTLSFNLHYEEQLDYRPTAPNPADRLMYIGLAAGIMEDPVEVAKLVEDVDSIEYEADGEESLEP